MAKKYKQITSDKKSEAKRIMNDNQIKKCNIAIHTASVSAGAAGAIPIPVADAIPITGVQVTMVIALGKVFGQKISESVAKAAISAAAATFVGRNLIKLIPIVGWGVSAAVAAGVTEAIGWMIAVDFANKAKNDWEKEYEPKEEACISEEYTSTDEANQDDDNNVTVKNIVETLKPRSEEFLSGKKTPSENKDEYDVLINDFENNIDKLDDILNDIYTKLVILGA